MASLAELILDQAIGEATGAISDKVRGLGFSDLQSDVIAHSIDNGLVNTDVGSAIIGLIPYVGGIGADRVVAELNHIGGIQDLASNNFPGFETETVTLPSGKTVDIYLDATPYLDGESSQFYVVESGHPNFAYVSNSELSSEDKEALNDIKKEMDLGARTDIYNHTPQHDINAYKNDLASQLEIMSHSSLQSDNHITYTASAGDPAQTIDTADAGIEVNSGALPSSTSEYPKPTPMGLTI